MARAGQRSGQAALVNDVITETVVGVPVTITVRTWLADGVGQDEANSAWAISSAGGDAE